MEILRNEIIEFGESIEPAFDYMMNVTQPITDTFDTQINIDDCDLYLHYNITFATNKIIAKNKNIKLTIIDYGETAHILTNTVDMLFTKNTNWDILTDEEIYEISEFLFTLSADPAWKTTKPKSLQTSMEQEQEIYLGGDTRYKVSLHIHKLLKSRIISLFQRKNNTIINNKSISTYDGKFQHSLTIRADGSWKIKYADDRIGPLVGYKVTRGERNEIVICVLHIPESSRLDTDDSIKFRADLVIVYDMFEPGYSPCAVCGDKTYLYEKPQYTPTTDPSVMDDSNYTFKCRRHINHTLASFVPVKYLIQSHSCRFMQSYIYTVKTPAIPTNGHFISRSSSCGIGIHFCISPVALATYANLS